MVMLPEGIDGAVVEFESPVCYGESNGFVVIDDIIGGVAPYTITVDGSELDGNFVDTLSAGTHTVMIVDESGCSWETTVSLDEGTLANVSAGPDLVIDIGDEANLTFETNLPSEYIDSIIWGPSHLLSCSICPSPTVSLFEEAMFSVTLVTVDGCEATDQLNVFVKEEIDYYIPNVFSPNSDGTNDQFTLYAPELPVTISDMLVFDRWGEQVFRAQNIQSNDPMQGWDGHFNGAMLQPGVYTYLFVIDDNGENERSTLSGDVTIIR
jgi:gliding motility-associated-like protein